MLERKEACDETEGGLVSLSPPPSINIDYSKLQYYHSKKNNKEYIIFAPHTNSNLPLYRYNFNTNKWDKFTKYPNQIISMCSILSIDQINHLLYISGGFRPCLATYNFNTNKWNIIHPSTSDNNQQMEGKGLILPNGEYHILKQTKMKNDHIRYNPITNTFVTISETAINNHCYLDGINFIYIKSKQFLMQFGGFSDEYLDTIWYTKYIENKSNYKWNEFPLKLPQAACVKVAVAFDAVVIIFDYKAKQTWILDLDCNDYQWMKSKLETNKHPKGSWTDMIITRSNEIHFIHAWKKEAMHFKIHLENFLPSNIYNKYCKNGQNDICTNDDEIKEPEIMNNNEEKLKMEMKELRQEIEKYMKNEEGLKRQLKEEREKNMRQTEYYKTEIMRLQRRNNELNDECKETKIKLIEVEEKLESLKKKNIDPKRFMEWTSDEFVDWICDLDDGRFEEYEKRLRKVFVEESIMGKAIPYIEKNDWKTWGIANFLDRTSLHKRVRNLVDSNGVSNESFNEGGQVTVYM